MYNKIIIVDLENMKIVPDITSCTGFYVVVTIEYGFMSNRDCMFEFTHKVSTSVYGSNHQSIDEKRWNNYMAMTKYIKDLEESIKKSKHDEEFFWKEFNDAFDNIGLKIE